MAYSTHGKTEPGDREELAGLLRAYDTALLTTLDGHGRFHTRPMAVQEEERGEVLWFATRVDTEKVQDLEANPRCGVAFYGGLHRSVYISMSGSAEVVRDREVIRSKWSARWKPWFPDGPDEPDLALIRFAAEHVEYVHPRGGTVKVLASLVKGLVTHRRPDPSPKYTVDLPAAAP